MVTQNLTCASPSSATYSNTSSSFTTPVGKQLSVYARSLVATTGMAVQEIGIPSGFEVDVDSIGKVKGLKRVETENRKVILYFDEVSLAEILKQFHYILRLKIVKLKPWR